MRAVRGTPVRRTAQLAGHIATVCPELLVASHAHVRSAATVASLTGSRGWGHLLVPGMLAATRGNSVATFVGLALAQFITRLATAVSPDCMAGNLSRSMYTLCIC